MKKYILILAYSLAILTLSHCDSSESEKVNNYVNDDGLIGKVKSTKEIVYIAIDNIGDVIKGNLHSGRYDDNFDKKEMNTYNLYNRQGNRIKKIDFTYFSIDNELDRARMWGRMSKKKWLEKEKGPSTNSQKNDSITILGNDSLINQKRTTNYRYNTQRKLVELDANWLNNKTLYKYDSVGKLIKETTYSFPRSKYSLIDNELILNDTTTSTYSYKYNSKRNISEVNYYYSGELIRIKKYTYSDSSKRLKIREYSKSGDYLGMEDITRDTLGNIGKSIDYDSDGVIDFINIYNSRGRLIEDVVGAYIDDETPSWYSKNKGDLYKKKTYEYNSNGYIAETIKSSYFLNNGNIEHTLILEQRNFEYQYDSTGNWINKIIYINHRPKYFIEKEINYFDETNSFNKKKINTKNENSPAKLKIDNGLFPNSSAFAMRSL